MELRNIILFTFAGFTLSYARYGKPRNGYDVMQLHVRILKGLLSKTGSFHNHHCSIWDLKYIFSEVAIIQTINHSFGCFCHYVTQVPTLLLNSALNDEVTVVKEKCMIRTRNRSRCSLNTILQSIPNMQAAVHHVLIGQIWMFWTQPVQCVLWHYPHIVHKCMLIMRLLSFAINKSLAVSDYLVPIVVYNATDVLFETLTMC